MKILPVWHQQKCIFVVAELVWYLVRLLLKCHTSSAFLWLDNCWRKLKRLSAGQSNKFHRRRCPVGDKILGGHWLYALAKRNIHLHRAFPYCKQNTFYDAVAGFWSQASSSLEQGMILLSQSNLCLSCTLCWHMGIGQLSEREVLIQLVGETYCLCNTGSKQDDHSNPLCSGSLGIEEWRCFAFAAACGDTKASWSFKNFGVFILWAGIMSKYILFF